MPVAHRAALHVLHTAWQLPLCPPACTSSHPKRYLAQIAAAECLWQLSIAPAAKARLADRAALHQLQALLLRATAPPRRRGAPPPADRYAKLASHYLTCLREACGPL